LNHHPRRPPTALATLASPPEALIPIALAAQARAFALEGSSPATRRAYRTAWRTFSAWCANHGLTALPAAPATVAGYITHLAESGRRVATIEIALAAITTAHRLADEESPRASAVVRTVARGIRRTLGVAAKQKAPVLVSELRAMLATLPPGLLGRRDRALLLVGFAAALRRSELVALNVEDVVFGDDGLTITIRRSKTDQEGVGRPVGVPFGAAPDTCPVRAVRAWLEAAGLTTGPLLRGVSRHGALLPGRLSDRAVARTVQRYAGLVGLDVARFAGHSLRAGLATAAAKAGKSERAIMAQTGHRSVVMVRRYIRDANLFTENAAAGLL
jgi:integrase